MDSFHFQSSKTTLLPLAAISVVIILVLRSFVMTVYNLFLHPLKSIPGPLAAKILPQYMSRAVIKGNRSHRLLELHETYGPYVRIGPNEVSISDYECYRQIYNHTSSVKEESFYKTSTLIGHDNTFNMRDKTQHSARRKMQNAPYSQQAINHNEPLIMEMVGRLLDRIMSESKKSTTSTADVYTSCGLFSVEVICRAAFNQDLDVETTGNSLAYLKSMDECSGTLLLGTLFPFLNKYRLGERLPGGAGHSFRQRTRWEMTTREMFRNFKRQSKLDTSQRFMATPLLLTKDEYLGRTLTEDEAIEEAMGLAFAGSGTTSTTIIYILYHLSRPENRDIQLRLREELQSTGSSLSEVKDLVYLNAIIKEAMRLNPSLMGSLPRTLTNSVTVDNAKGVVLPPGTVISMQNYVHQRNPKVYPDPLTFNPERWIGQPPSSSVERALTPFSLGPRNCIGQNLAKAELFLAVSSIFRRLDLRLNQDMKESDMEMVDRLVAVPKSRKLLLDVVELV